MSLNAHFLTSTVHPKLNYTTVKISQYKFLNKFNATYIKENVLYLQKNQGKITGKKTTENVEMID